MSVLRRIKNVFTREVEKENTRLGKTNQALWQRVEQLQNYSTHFRVLNNKIYAQQQEIFNRDQKIKELEARQNVH